jgi:hypothetical protein
MFLNNKNASCFVPFVVKCLAGFEHDFTGKILTISVDDPFGAAREVWRTDVSGGRKRR